MVRPEKPAENRKEGRLPGAIRTNQSRDHALLQVDGRVFYRHDTTKGFCDVRGAKRAHERAVRRRTPPSKPFGTNMITSSKISRKMAFCQSAMPENTCGPSMTTAEPSTGPNSAPRPPTNRVTNMLIAVPASYRSGPTKLVTATYSEPAIAAS